MQIESYNIYMLYLTQFQTALKKNGADIRF